MLHGSTTPSFMAPLDPLFVQPGVLLDVHQMRSFSNFRFGFWNASTFSVDAEHPPSRQTRQTNTSPRRISRESSQPRRVTLSLVYRRLARWVVVLVARRCRCATACVTRYRDRRHSSSSQLPPPSTSPFLLSVYSYGC